MIDAITSSSAYLWVTHILALVLGSTATRIVLKRRYQTADRNTAELSRRATVILDEADSIAGLLEATQKMHHAWLNHDDFDKTECDADPYRILNQFPHVNLKHFLHISAVLPRWRICRRRALRTFIKVVAAAIKEFRDFHDTLPELFSLTKAERLEVLTSDMEACASASLAIHKELLRLHILFEPWKRPSVIAAAAN